MDTRFDGADAGNLADLLEDQTVGPASPLVERAGSKIGRYKLMQLIGEGGFGSVFMAEQESPVVRRVALKVIKLGMDTKQVIARFAAERQALAMMDHPNIAKVLDAGTTESGRPYFVMELVPGVPFTQYCNRKRLTLRQRIELFIPVCRAVQHAHQKGIIHRDLKPSNILVMTYDGNPVPKVIDFGVAKALHQRLTEKTLFTQFGNTIGTPEYMSPEQADMDLLGADTRSDIYSLGVLLYELLTGVTPLDRAKLREAGYTQMLRIIREQEPVRPSTRLTQSDDALATISADRGTDPRELTRQTVGDLDVVVMKCLEKDRARRYDTADGLARDLERYLNDEPVEALPPSAADRFRRFTRKNRVAISATSGFVLMLAGATALSSWQALRATRSEIVAVKERKRADEQASSAGAARRAAEVNLADALIAQGDALMATDQSRVAKEKYRLAADLLRTNGQSSFPAEIALWDANRRSPSPLIEVPAHTGEVTHLRFFRDGNRLATAGADGTARIWEMKTGRPIRTLSGLGDVQRLSVSSDGGLIAFASTTTGVTLWKTADGVPTRKIGGYTGRASAVSFSPDDRFLLVGTADPPYQLCLFDASSGEVVRKFSGHQAAIRDVAFTPDGTKALSCDGRPPEDKISWRFKPRLCVWDVKGGTLLWSRAADSEDRLIGQLAVSDKGDMVATTSWDGIAKVWDVASGDVRSTTGSSKGHEVQGVAFSSKGNVAVGGPFGSIRVLGREGMSDVTEGTKHYQLAGHASETRTIDFSPDGRVLASGGSDGIVRIWPIYAGGEVRVFPDFEPGKIPDEIGKVEVSPDGRLALSVANSIRLWDVFSSTEIKRIPGRGAVFAPEGRIVVIEDDGWIGVWDNELRRRLGNLDPPIGRQFNRIALAPGGRTLLAGFTDGDDLAVFDMPTHTLLKRLRLPNWRRLCFSPDGTFAAGVSQGNNLLKIWGTADWREWCSIPVPRPRWVTVSPDSHRVATVGADVRVFEPRSGALANHFDGVPDSFGAVGFLPDSRYLLAEGPPPEGLVLWDLARDVRVRSLALGTFIFDLSVSPEGTLLWSQRSMRGAMNVARLDWSARCDAIATRAEAAQHRLLTEPKDVDALATLAEWYAFREMPDWAIELLDRAGPSAEGAKLLEICRKRSIAEDSTSRYHNEVTRMVEGIDVISEQIRQTASTLQVPVLFDSRAAQYARISRFQEALSDYKKAVELDPENHLHWHDGFVPLLLQTGDVEGYRHWRSEELRRFRNVSDGDAAHRAAKDACMMPLDGEDLKIAVELADRSVAVGKLRWCADETKGMTEYRSGHFKEAIPYLIKCRDAVEGKVWVPQTEFFLAMAYERVGSHEQACAAIARGLKAREDHPKLENGILDLRNVCVMDWVFNQIAYREAQKLIYHDGPTTLSTDSTQRVR